MGKFVHFKISLLTVGSQDAKDHCSISSYDFVFVGKQFGQRLHSSKFKESCFILLT